MSLFPLNLVAFSANKDVHGIWQSILEDKRIATFPDTPKKHRNSRHGSPALPRPLMQHITDSETRIQIVIKSTLDLQDLLFCKNQKSEDK